MWYIYTVEYYSAIKKYKIMPLAATWMELETLILSEVSQKKTNTIWYHLYPESNIWHKWTYLQKENKLMDLENRLVVAKGRGEGVGRTGSWGLIDANYYIWNRYAMRSCWIAQGTISNHLWRNMMEDNVRKRMYMHIYMYMYVWLGHFSGQQKLTGYCKSTIEK